MIRKIIDILSRQDKGKFILLFSAILILGFLEVIGIASVLPFMELLSKSDAISESSLLTRIYNTFGFEDQRSFLIASGGFVIFIIALSNLFSIATNYFQLRFSWNISHRMETQLLKYYASKPYSYFLTQNTSELRAYLIAEVATVTSGVLIPLIEFISRSIVCLVIFTLLLLVSLEVTVTMIAFLGGAYLLIYVSRQRFLKKLGKQRIEANTKRYKYLEEMLTGIKTVKIYGVQDAFYERYERVSKAFSKIQPKVQMTYATPKYILEILAFGGILSITLYLYVTTGDLTKALPRLSLYAVAGYRLLPSLQRAFASISKVKHNVPSLHKLYNDLMSSKLSSGPISPAVEKMSFNQKIKVENLGFKYDGSSTDLLNNISFTIEKGSVAAFVGSTGSGKTTLIDMITGLLFSTSGQIWIDDEVLHSGNAQQWQKNIAYVPQEVFLYDDTIRANIAIGENEQAVDERQLIKAMKLADIHDFVVSQLAEGLDTKIGERGIRLSGGQRQRLGLARALYRKPSLLVLDEATSALDNITERGIIKSLRSLPKGLTTIVIAHRLSSVRYADNIFLLENGMIMGSGQYEDLLKESDQFKKMTEYME